MSDYLNAQSSSPARTRSITLEEGFQIMLLGGQMVLESFRESLLSTYEVGKKHLCMPWTNANSMESLFGTRNVAEIAHSSEQLNNAIFDLWESLVRSLTKEERSLLAHMSEDIVDEANREDRSCLEDQRLALSMTIKMLDLIRMQMEVKDKHMQEMKDIIASLVC